MKWIGEVLSRLESEPCCGYRVGGVPAIEPTALAAMALAAHGRREAAATALGWLARIQSSDGSLGVTAAAQPCWPTGWALLAWRWADSIHAVRPLQGEIEPTHSPQTSARYGAMVQRATAWILSFRGCPAPPSDDVLHDTTLMAWPWVEGTHSWVEPTAINLLALKACGYVEHLRSRDAVRLLRDRAVRTGGWNYGNPGVFGATLPPHVQSTGLALAALCGEPSAAREIDLAVAFLRRSLSAETATASLCYAMLGLAAHGKEHPRATGWLEHAARRTLDHGAAPYALALVALAVLGHTCPWFAPPLRPVADRAACPSNAPSAIGGIPNDAA